MNCPLLASQNTLVEEFTKGSPWNLLLCACSQKHTAIILISFGTRKVDPILGQVFLFFFATLGSDLSRSQYWTPPPACGLKAYLRVVRSEDGILPGCCGGFHSLQFFAHECSSSPGHGVFPGKFSNMVSETKPEVWSFLVLPKQAFFASQKLWQILWRQETCRREERAIRCGAGPGGSKTAGCFLAQTLQGDANFSQW